MRFPVWGDGEIKFGTSYAFNGQVVRVGGYRVRLDNVPKGARLEVKEIPKDATTPKTRRVLVMRFDIPAGKPVRMGQTLLLTD